MAEKRRLDAIVENGGADDDPQPDRRIKVIESRAIDPNGLAGRGGDGRALLEDSPFEQVQGLNVCSPNGAPVNLPESLPVYVEGDLVRPGGSRLTLGVTYTPLYDSTGRLLILVVNVVDITRFVRQSR